MANAEHFEVMQRRGTPGWKTLPFTGQENCGRFGCGLGEAKFRENKARDDSKQEPSHFAIHRIFVFKFDSSRNMNSHDVET